VLFALAAVHFADQGIEWAAVEVGIGGRWDPTNLLASDVAVITTVSLEHTQILGDTVEAIAAEKAAIIKPGSDAVTASQDERALHVIEGRAAGVRARLLRVGREVRVVVKHEHIQGQRLELGSDEGSVEVSLPLAGTFQALNVAAAYGAVLSLRHRGVPITDDALVAGIEAVRVPGRFELISFEPLVILDGAHHPAAVAELRRTLETLGGSRRIVVLFAAMADKDASKMASELAPVAGLVCVTRAPGTDRAAEPRALAAAFEAHGVPVVVEEDADAAYRKLLAGLTPDDLLLVTGSLYLVGHVRNAVSAEIASL
jgi:dihydrofolate synthase/folylpolyglutamate synthase